MTVLSTIRVIVGAIEAPEDSQLEYWFPVLLGVLTTLLFTVFMCSVFWFTGSVRVRHIKAEFGGTSPIPVVHIAGIAEDGNEVLTALGSTHSYKKPENASLSFGAGRSGLVVYRRFNHRIAFFTTDRIKDVFYERRTIAAGMEREVMSFLIADEAGNIHSLGFTIFNHEQLLIIPYSRAFKQNMLREFKEALGLTDGGV
ncbi:hypothetical protein [Leucobacter komagatae]|nr:hypothetical protein [Leucobacter komagatae]